VLAAVKYPGWLVEGDGGIFFLQVGNFHPPLCVSGVVSLGDGGLR